MQSATGQTRDPASVSHVLRGALETAGAIAQGTRWTRLDGGRSNCVWLVQDAGNAPDPAASPPRATGPHHITAAPALVAKLFVAPADEAAANPMFPNDGRAEVAILDWLAPHGLAPQSQGLWATQAGDCLLYRHRPGTIWQSDTAPVARLLGRLHAMPPPPGLRRAPDGSHAIAAVTEAILASCPDGPDRRRIAVPLDLPAVPPCDRRALLHGDPVPGNVIVDDRGPSLIDWQCPAIGDPCEDLALFLSPAMQHLYRGRPLTAREEDAFLAACPDRDSATRHRRLAPWYHRRMAAYCLWRSQGRAGRDLAAARLELAACERAVAAICA